MSDPTNVALYGHRFQPIIKNDSSGSGGIGWDRVQTHDNRVSLPTQRHYELARVGPVGSTQSPVMVDMTVDQNLVNNFEQEWIIAGKDPAPVGAQSYNLGDIVAQADALTAYLLALNVDDTVLGEWEVGACTVTGLTFRHTIGGPITLSTRLRGRNPLWHPQAQVVHGAFVALDDTSYGGIHGKDVAVWLSAGSTPSSRQFRVQDIEISVDFPSATVNELGRRNNVGTVADSPDVSITMNTLLADEQLIATLFQLSGSDYDLANPTAVFPLYLRVFDPLATEATSVLRMLKVENCKIVGGTPVRAAVRGLATSSWNLISEKNTVSNSGGLIVSNRNDL